MPDGVQRVDELNRTAVQLRQQGKFKEALSVATGALRLAKEKLDDDHPDTATSLNNLGLAFCDLGHYTEALPYFEQALAIKQNVLGDHPDTAVSLHNLSGLLLNMGGYAKAQHYAEQALAVFRKTLGDDHPDTASCLNQLGGLLHAMGDYAGARHYVELALAVFRKTLGDDHPKTARTLNNLGGLLHAMGDYAGAPPYYEQALTIRRKTLGDDHPDTAQSLNNLGALRLDLGDSAGALPYFERALAVHRKTLGDHPDTAGSLHNLGELLQNLGNFAGAQPYHEQALAIFCKTLGNDHPDTATTLRGLGNLYAATNRAEEAWLLMQQAAAIDDRMIGQVFSIGSESQRAAVLKSRSANLEISLSLVLGQFNHSSPHVAAALDAVLRRKALGAEALAAQRDVVLGGRYPQLKHSLHELSALRAKIASKTLAGPGLAGLEAHRRLLTEWETKKQRQEADLARQIPEMNLERKLRAADRRAIAHALPENTALVEFVRFDVFDFHAVKAHGEKLWKPPHYLAFVLHAGAPDDVHMIDLGLAAPIDRMIADFRAGITGEDESGQQRAMTIVHDLYTSPNATGEPETTARPELREAVFDPLWKALAGRTRLLLAPDGDMCRLPFEVLPTDDCGGRLIDYYQISYVASGRDVLRFGAPSSGRPTADLVAADPDFDLSSESVIDDLPRSRLSRDLDRATPLSRLAGTRVEGEQVAALLGVQPWRGQAVLDASLKQIDSPRILHLATHGFFLKDQPHDPNLERHGLATFGGGPDWISGPPPENPLLRSGLLLAGFNVWRAGGRPPAEAEDGVLTAEDVTDLNLLGTELVVLSACETGLGHVQIGEGVLGLRRAFVLAGARTLVMSLWKVPDRQTQELMADFYRRILTGEPRAEALRQAQLALKALHPNPRYWGAFICQGEPFPLPPNPSTAATGLPQPAAQPS